MKESTLVKMKYDLKILQQALAVAFHRIEKLEKNEPVSGGSEGRESTGEISTATDTEKIS